MHQVNVSVHDSNNYSISSAILNISIFNNTFPVWVAGTGTNHTITEEALFYLHLRDNVTDSENNNLTFNYVLFNSFPVFNSSSFNSTNGTINLTADDADVGYHLVNISADDGYVNGTITFNFTVFNTNDAPSFETSQWISSNMENATINTTNYRTNVSEDSAAELILFIDDNDFESITQKSFYNESLTITTNITGPNSNLFSFFAYSSYISPDKELFSTSFTPNKTDVGDYNITIIVNDSSSSEQYLFNLTVDPINHKPNLYNISNQSSAVGLSLNLTFNASDVEDGTEAEGNLLFLYEIVYNSSPNLHGLLSQSGSFNDTYGILNVTFNSSHAGLYSINISVIDSEAFNDSKVFWLSVYDSPIISSPSSGDSLTIAENETQNITFLVNHSVKDNLTYYIYLEDSLRANLSLKTNGSLYNWSFTPNFTDETYGLIKNFTLFIFNSDYSYLNASVNWSVNITHTNSPVNFSGRIPDQSATVANNISLNMASYFSDVDYSDTNYNQEINFSFSTNKTGSSTITARFSNWSLLITSTTTTNEYVNITATDYSSNSTSNNFYVVFNEENTSSSTTTSSSSSGGGSTVSVLLKLLLPDPVSADKNTSIVLPITLSNDGKNSLNGIKLKSVISKNGTVVEGIESYFDIAYIPSLGIGQNKKVVLTIETNTNETGLFEVYVEANVDNPKYKDWGKLYYL